VENGNFKLLGAPIGSPDYCAAHTDNRREKAATLLGATQRLSHVQGGAPHPPTLRKLLQSRVLDSRCPASLARWRATEIYSRRTPGVGTACGGDVTPTVLAARAAELGAGRSGRT
jgi:hypothetical protein